LANVISDGPIDDVSLNVRQLAGNGCLSNLFHCEWVYDKVK